MTIRLLEAALRARDERGDVPGWVMITVMSDRAVTRRGRTPLVGQTAMA